jgi:hypothetical protein
MGGNLFTSKRLNADEYQAYQTEVLSMLPPGRTYLVPKSFHNKKNYGDLDILAPYYQQPTDVSLVDELKHIFSCSDDQVKINSSVISLQYKDFQCDFCYFEPEDLETAFNYYSHSDCANIVGNLARYATGYRLTHRGLMYPVKLKQEDQLGEIVVSKNWESILPFLNLDYAKWESGFDDELDLFQWITQSRYFNADCFKFENLNHENSTRNRKRQTYAMFVNWLAEQKDNLPNHYTASKDKQEHLFRGLLHFQEEGYWIERAQPLVQERYYVEEARKVFNAHNIMQITGLSCSALGQTRRDFNQYLESVVDRRRDLYNSVAQFISEHETNEIEEIFTNWYDENDTN